MSGCYSISRSWSTTRAWWGNFVSLPEKSQATKLKSLDLSQGSSKTKNRKDSISNYTGVSVSVLVPLPRPPSLNHLVYNFYPYNLILGVSLSVLFVFLCWYRDPWFVLIPRPPIVLIPRQPRYRYYRYRNPSVIRYFMTSWRKKVNLKMPNVACIMICYVRTVVLSPLGIWGKMSLH